MTKVKKTAFLILRVDGDFKVLVLKRAKGLGKTLSEFVRDILDKAM